MYRHKKYLKYDTIKAHPCRCLAYIIYYMKRGWKIVLWVVGVLLGIILLATLLISPIAKSYINSHGKELVGREVHVDDVTINVYTGHVAILGLTLYEDNGQDIFASFDTLDTKASLFKLIGNTIELDHITLSGLNVNVIKRGETFNFQSMLDHFASDSTEEVQDTTPSEWIIKLHNIRLSHAQIHYNDVTENKQWHLPDINLRVPNFELGGDQASQGGLNIAFSEGGHLNIDGNYHEQKGTYDLAVNIKQFNIKNLEPIITDLLNYQKIAGNINLRLKAQGNVSEIGKSRIGGTVAVTGVDLQNNGGQVVSWNRLDITVNNINLDANSFDVQSIKLDGLTARYDQWADHSNIDLLTKSEETSESPECSDSLESPESSSPLSLTLHNLSIANTSLIYTDHTLPDLFTFPITDLTLEANDLTLDGANNAKLRATLPGGGHLLVKWTGDISHWKQHQDLFIAIKGLDMKQLSPWSVYYTGQPIEDGIFSLTSHNTIKNSVINGQNKIDIYKAQVGSRRKDIEPQQKLPLKVALYILKDKDEKILFDIPVKGNIDSPEFSYMKIVWQTLGNLLIKVATSPIRALGNVFGFGSDNLEFIEIEAGQRGLSSEQYHLLSDLATIAKSDSLVSISLEQRMPSPANDSVARSYEFRNGIVRHYLLEQGVNEHQFSVTTGEPVTDGEKTGYAITSEMKLEE